MIVAHDVSKDGAPPLHGNPWQSHTAVVRDVTPEVAGVATYHLALAEAKQAAAYSCEPGQFNMLYLPGVGEAAISVSGAGPGGAWAHTVRVAGNATRALERLGRGSTLGLRGPFGSSWPLQRCRGEDVVLVAGGIGLAPLRPAIRRLLADRQQYGRLTLIYGARTPDSLLFNREYSEWSNAGMNVLVTVDRAAPGWSGNVGVAPLLVDRLRPFDPKRCVLLACGPEVMMEYTVRSALCRGLAPERLWLSLERNMQCAVGMCGHCQLGPLLVCRDGPVFRYDKAADWLKVSGL